ncbi:MAG: ABC transporter ATP-binding protein [Clostridia bacterium]|nr:ABC transporter ATP-binding protein [Clostridia bacterium]
MNTPVLMCDKLCKSYTAGLSVLNNFSFSLTRGKIVGLLGPNGCGKSTLLKLIAGILVADSGEIKICGHPRSEQTNALISYLPERPYFQPSMRVVELLDYFSDFYADFDRERATRMLTDLGIPQDVRMKTLSKGTKEKVQLVLVMSRRASLYLLDEPIGGVDPAARDYILQTIIGNYDPEATVMITTHLITDIEPVLDDFLFMGHGGQILLSGNADEVRAQHGKSLNELFREVFRC